jgi:amino acid adenylation domain-containing protein
LKFEKFLDECIETGISFSLRDDNLAISAPEGTLNKVQVEKIKSFKSALIKWLHQQNKQKLIQQRPEIKSIERENIDISTSFPQQRLWFLDQLNSGSADYNMGGALKIEGELHPKIVERAFRYLVERHEPLRTVFCNSDNGPVQVIQSTFNFELTQFNLDKLAAEEQNTKVLELIDKEMATAFDLSNDLMIRAIYIRLSEKTNILGFTLHHIASDGWSMGVLTQEFVHICSALMKNQSVELKPLTIQYADYAIWQRAWLQGEVLAVQTDYWRRQLENIPLLHSLPTKPRPSIQTFKGKTHKFKVGSEISTAAKRMIRQHECTTFMLLHSVLSILLAKYSNADDIVIGTPVANRLQKELESLVGFFANTLVLRTNVSSEDSFSDFLKNVREVNLDALEHQDVPFELIVEKINPERNMSYSPVFQILFSMDSTTQENVSLSGLKIEALQAERQSAKFDLTLNAQETDNHLFFEFEYNEDLFEPWFIQQMANHYLVLLESVVKQPNTEIKYLSLLTVEEQNRLLTTSECPNSLSVERCIHQLFEEKASQYSDNIAIEYLDQRLTYCQLNKRANQLAHYLIAQGVQPGDLVGLCIERSIEMVIGLLAVLKTGAAYVPLDPEYPKNRLQFMLDDSQANLVLTQNKIADRFLAGAKLLCLDDIEIQKEVNIYNNENPSVSQLSAEYLSHIIYTSGSTGKPKGVCIRHKNVASLMSWVTRSYSEQECSKTLFSTSICFDLSIFEIWAPLLSGGRMVLVRNILDILEQDFSPSLINTVPSAMETLLLNQYHFNNTLVINLAGEPLKRTLVNQVFEQSNIKSLNNLYGPSEDTTYSTYKRYFEPVSESVVIGSEIDYTQLFVLDNNLQLVPDGVVGELFIGGAGLAQGYLNNPEMTAEKFIVSPFDGKTILYKTGDLVRRLPNAELDYIGRMDHQVKVRGFRIELGEIESQLELCSGVNDSVVFVRDDQGQEKRIVAYIISPNKINDNEFIGQLKLQLAKSLPSYMLPTAFVVLERWPLTLNGKIDRKRLPPPGDDSVVKAIFVAPRDEIETCLSEIWSELLQLEKVGVEDDFFALGGHSLLVIRVISNVRQKLKIELPVRIIFELPTIAELALYIQQNEVSSTTPAIKPADRNAPLMLSFSQQRLWFIDQLEPNSSQYNMPGAFKISGDFDASIFEKCIDNIVERHEILRTTYISESGSSYQIINRNYQSPVSIIDLTNETEENLKRKIEEISKADAVKPFDLMGDVLIRVTLIKMSTSEYMVLFNMHHIAFDGWSMGVLMNEVEQYYRHYLDGVKLELPELDIQYADYANWQRDWLNDDELTLQINYWKQQLANLPLVHELPLDKSRATHQTFNSKQLKQNLNKQMSQSLLDFSKSKKVTLFMLLQSAFSLLLSRYSGENDIVMGTPVSGRGQKQIEPLIGFFVNTLVLRSNISSDDNFSEFLSANKNMILDAFSHEKIPFDMLVETIKPTRSLSYSPLFQVMFTLQNKGDSLFELPRVALSSVEQPNATMKYDLELEIVEHDEGLTLHWGFNSDLFITASIEQLSLSFQVMLNSILQTPEKNIKLLDILPHSSIEKLTNLWNSNCQEFPEFPECTRVLELFERQLVLNSDKEALCYKQHSLSYSQLDKVSNRLAHYLIHCGVSYNSIVAVCLERSIDLVVSVLAILKAGAAYLPLAPEYPDSRLQYMIDDSGTKFVITKHNISQRFTNTTEFINLDILENDKELVAFSHKTPKLESALEDPLAYVIYTSGTTGNPKGVMLGHKGLINLALTSQQLFHLNNKSRVMQFASFSFDAATLEWVSALTTGATLHIVDSDIQVDPNKLKRWMLQREINFAVLTPAFLSQLSSEISHSLDTIVVGGEAFDISLAKKWAKNCRLFNLYGPTEATIYGTYKQIEPTENHITIGKPIANMECYITDEYNQLVPIGVAGELCLAGVGVAKGYHNRAELSQERFAPNPFSCSPHSRLYRTGDRVRWLNNGEIDFLGRIDHQVKLRGLRIELGEIESLLLKEYVVKEAVVVTRGEGVEKQLAGFVVLQANLLGGKNHSQVTQQMKENLHQVLPDFMVPASIAVLESIPLTNNGKIDRVALQNTVNNADIDELIYVAPVSQLQKTLCEVWQRLLSREPIGIDDNFFAIGGHSLLVMKLAHDIFETLNITIEIKDIFLHSTIRTLSNLIEKSSTLGVTSASLLTNLLAPQPSLPNLYCIPGAGGFAASFYEIAQSLGGSLNVKAFDYQGVMNEVPVHATLDEIVDHYFNEIIDEQSDGVYFVLGHSFGGLVAYELVSRLNAQGKVAHLIALDSYLLPQYLPKTVFTMPYHFDENDLSEWLLSHQQEGVSDISKSLLNEGRGILEKLKSVYQLQSSMMRNYSPSSRLLGNILYLHASDSAKLMQESKQLSLIEKLTYGKIMSQEVVGDHYSILNSKSVAELVNGFVTTNTL